MGSCASRAIDSRAKMALVGLMQTLAIEGTKYDIRVNCLAPTAATQMTEACSRRRACVCSTRRVSAPAAEREVASAGLTAPVLEVQR